MDPHGEMKIKLTHLSLQDVNRLTSKEGDGHYTIYKVKKGSSGYEVKLGITYTEDRGETTSRWLLREGIDLVFSLVRVPQDP